MNIKLQKLNELISKRRALLVSEDTTMTTDTKELETPTVPMETKEEAIVEPAEGNIANASPECVEEPMETKEEAIVEPVVSNEATPNDTSNVSAIEPTPAKKRKKR